MGIISTGSRAGIEKYRCGGLAGLYFGGYGMSKMTDWFPPHIEPCADRPGVYSTIMYFGDGTKIEGLSRWSGSFWSDSYDTIKDADADKGITFGCQDKYWRGFTEPQE